MLNNWNHNHFFSHIDPRVNAALLTLIGMGLENEGNLAEILELVDGDIASALELIEIPK